ncbi:MAG: hypothetical protein SWJ54_19100 [Cyanobacteriota bacterium]|nr:hypothetical protein [Cyanobacteriota bacterium]
MSQAIEQLQAEWNEIKAQVDEIQAEYDLLCDKRASFQVIILFPKDDSPEAQAEFQNNCQTQMAKWSVNLAELDREIKATGFKLKKVQTKLAVKQNKLYELQAKELWPQLVQQAQNLNQIAEKLEQEVKIFWQIAHNFQPRFAEWLPELPRLSTFEKSTTIPKVKQSKNGLYLINEEINVEDQK